jgi:hypothetical protein
MMKCPAITRGFQERTMTRLATTLALVLAIPGLGGAQGRLSLDLRVPTAATTHKLNDAELSMGYGLGATVAYRLQPHLHLYGGWDYLHFSADQSFAGADREFVETGYTYGLRFQHPLQADRVMYRVEAGGTYKHVEIENKSGDIIANSGHSAGLEGGAGLAFATMPRWQVVPMLRYRALFPEFTIGATKSSGALRYFSVEIGASRAF